MFELTVNVKFVVNKVELFIFHYRLFIFNSFGART